MIVEPTNSAFTTIIAVVSHVLLVGHYGEASNREFPKEARASQLHALIKIFKMQTKPLLVLHGPFDASNPFLQIGNTICRHYNGGQNEPFRCCVL